MNKKDIVNILFCGRGGQGVLAAAEVCGWAAVLSGFHVKKSEMHGMAQRGGSVESHLRFGKEVFSPLIPKGEADFIIPFDGEEFIRLKSFLKNNGVCLVDDLNRGKGALKGQGRYINVFLLGALSRYLSIDKQFWFEAIEIVFAGKNPRENKGVFLKGREQGGGTKGDAL
ncbi:MAG: 2-oxoacid:acceptor oxidoreductase family protein [Candidatus Omnitrophica bacterium]|nr:2-oxoacid:acceptor oxidoreductase family protein [Candidatus Omnitrophota bacterium]